MTDTRQRPGAVELALSAEQVADFCAWLQTQSGVTGDFIHAALAERYGVTVGRNAAYTFKDKVFAEHLERLNKRRQLAQFLTAHSAPEDGAKIADAAASELSQGVFDFLVSNDAPIDLNSPQGQEQANTLALIISRLRRGDHTLRALEAKLEEIAAREKKALQAVNELTSASNGGASLESRNALRTELGLAPLAA